MEFELKFLKFKVQVKFEHESGSSASSLLSFAAVTKNLIYHEVSSEEWLTSYYILGFSVLTE